MSHELRHQDRRDPIHALNMYHDCVTHPQRRNISGESLIHCHALRFSPTYKVVPRKSFCMPSENGTLWTNKTLIQSNQNPFFL